MLLFTIEAVPKTTNPEAHELGGAYVLCLIDFVDAEGAEIVAWHYIDQYGWQPRETTDVNVVERADYETDPDFLAYYDQAIAEGTCFIYHSWPIDAEDGEEAVTAPQP